MPTTYAHYRFGEEMLRLMPADVRGTAKRYRQLFDVGLQGPDPLFYYRSMLAGKVQQLGQIYHMQTGREFFSRACRNLRREPGEGGQAYLYGVLCHFALDANCRPLAACAESTVRVESAFDRFLMKRDGLVSVGQLFRKSLTEREWGTISRFYPGTDRRILRNSMRSMIKARRLLELEEGPARSVGIMTIGLGSGIFREMVAGLTAEPEGNCWNQLLMERYQQAAEGFSEMLLKLIAHLQYNAPLGEKFDPIFG